MERQERTYANMEATDYVDTKQSKQRASIKWLLSKAFNNRVPENLQEPFYRDHEDQEHLKPPICGGLANAELYCLALANMYSDPNYHSLNHWNILQTFARKGVHVPDPPDCALTETVLIQTNPLKMSAHMSVIEALMVLYAREVVTLDRVAAAAQRFGITQPLPPSSAVPHEDGILCWVNAATAALNRAEEDSSPPVPMVSSLQELCDGTALAALVSFYCPEALPRSAVRVGRMSSVQDCLHNLRLVYDFCRSCIPHNVFHMMPEDVTYMRGSMRQNLVAMLADLFNMLEVHPVKSVKYPGAGVRGCNEHGVCTRARCLPPPPPTPIPDLRPERTPSAHQPPFAVPRSPSACGSRGRAASVRSACSTPERRSMSPQREEFVVHRGRGVTTLASLARRDDDNVIDSNQSAAGQPSNWAETRQDSFAGRRSRRSSISEDSQLTVENFGGSQDRLHFAGRNPEKELATLANVRKISAPAGPLDSYNPPLRSSRQDIRGSIQFIHGELTNGTDDRDRRPEPNTPEPARSEPTLPPIRRQLSSDTITLSRPNFAHKGGGDGFYLNERDSTDGDTHKISFADLDRFRNGDQTGLSQFGETCSEQPDRRKTTTFSTPSANTTTWQQQFMQHENHPNGEDLTDDLGNSPSGGQAMAAQLNNIRLKLEEKRRRIEQDKRRMEMAVSRQRQQLGQQAFLQAVTRDAYLQYQLASLGKGSSASSQTKEETTQAQEMVVEAPSQSVDNVVLEQYQQSIAKMNSSLADIQSDIARLASQQNQIQQQQQQQHQQQQAKELFQLQQKELFQQQKELMLQQQQAKELLMQQQQAKELFQQQQQAKELFQQQQQAKELFQQQQAKELYQQQQNQLFQQQQMQPQSPYQQHYQQNIPQLHHQFSSSSNVSRGADGGFGSSPQLAYRDMERTFFLHESPPHAPAPRRTWAQHAHHQHENELRWQLQQQQQQQQQHHYGGAESPHRTWRSPSPAADRWQPQAFVLHEPAPAPAPAPAPREQYTNGETEGAAAGRTLSPRRLAHPAPPPPPPDDMEPQNISFIGSGEGGDAEAAVRASLDRLNISSGTRTYRLPSPTRPALARARDSFRRAASDAQRPEKGFYISFDDDPPKRPKPPLRAKRISPRKERPDDDDDDEWEERPPPRPAPAPAPTPQHAGDPFPVHRAMRESPARSQEPLMAAPTTNRNRVPPAEPAAMVIGEVNIDPNSAEEMERKKERIMLLSLQRRQRADEARARADAAAAARRAREDAANEAKAARKEEQARRREAILAQYKLKKAMEEAEREGKALDKTEYIQSLRAGGMDSTPPPAHGGTTRARRGGAPARARPKTIHVDSGALHQAEGMLTTKQPSATSLAGGTMRRDYYRGSQDSLAERAQLYRDSPVEERGGGGMSPGSASSGALGRRGSCKTSRERVNEEPQSARGRSKFSSYQSNFKAGRKSSSLMNLCDSGLGRATPPRRAASPGGGGGGLRALCSPAGSGPGSLPGAIGKRRHHPDDASDVSSTHSSIMDYSGPRLYKQPTTKSNRGIMLNAVEYCVFPGAVNAEAKRRVLEEIARSESKHFLVLFRDAGCQFRALYSYCPDTDDVAKLYGTGPKHVNDRMFDKFFKYNSGSKCFSQVHTKHLTVTIDAFTIHNSLWQGKKVQLPSKKDMALVI